MINLGKAGWALLVRMFCTLGVTEGSMRGLAAHALLASRLAFFCLIPFSRSTTFAGVGALLWGVHVGDLVTTWNL